MNAQGKGTARAAWTQYLEYRVNQLGLQGYVGLAALALGLAFLGSVVLPLYRSVTDLRAQVHSQPAAGHGPAAAATALDRASSLPPRAELPRLLGTVLAQAKAAGIELTLGSYDFAVLHAGEVGRYRLHFPIAADYPHVRHFLDLTRAAVPAVAIETLRLARKDAGNPAIDADVQFSLYLRMKP